MFIVLGLYSQIWYLFLYQYAPPVWSPCNPTNREVAQLSNDAMGAARLIPMGSNQNSTVALSSRNDMMSILQRSVRTNEGRQRNSDFKLLCHGWFHYVRHHVHDGHYTGEFATVIWRLDSFTVSFRGDVGGESGLKRTCLSQSQNFTMGTWPIYKNYFASLVRKMASHKIPMHVLNV